VRLPEKGLSRDEVFARLEAHRAHDVPWRDGRTFAYVYDPGPEAEELIRDAYAMFLGENALDPTVFPSALRFETELVAMAATQLRGDETVVGNVSSGGTESILLAVKAARDYARARRPGVRQPEMILPVTAHAAFQKAAHYLDVKPVRVPVDGTSFRADPDAVRRAITRDTILLVGSAVSYAHGVVDPIRELGELALEHGLLLHVDACMGGFLLPFFRRLGAPVTDFDFTVPGVTSISMDLHKYAFAAKGASTILYRSDELRRFQIYTCADWTGYSVVNPTMQSTKSVGPLAAAWAILHFLGEEGYLRFARSMLESTRKIVAAIDAHPDLRVLGRPEMNLVAFTSDRVGVFQVIDEMRARGWYVQPQLAHAGSKENIHLSVNPTSERWVDAFLGDLAECVEAARGRPAEAGGELERAVAALGDRPLAPEALAGLLAAAGVQGSALPERMAGINQLMNALPTALREQLLTEYFNQLYRLRE
jgi:glutamate/tyrosine decarboxylase-like PLP-dependent enzyme